MVHQKKLQRMLRLFCCTIPYSAAFSLARGRAPGNVAGVERRGDGERQGLEIKKVQVCKSVYGNNKFDGNLLRNF